MDFLKPMTTVNSDSYQNSAENTNRAMRPKFVIPTNDNTSVRPSILHGGFLSVTQDSQIMTSEAL